MVPCANSKGAEPSRMMFDVCFVFFSFLFDVPVKSCEAPRSITLFVNLNQENLALTHTSHTHTGIPRLASQRRKIWRGKEKAGADFFLCVHGDGRSSNVLHVAQVVTWRALFL